MLIFSFEKGDLIIPICVLLNQETSFAISSIVVDLTELKGRNQIVFYHGYLQGWFQCLLGRIGGLFLRI